ncbi:MAG: sodium-translocating pyrophosphatase [Anaerolineales bacterium]
MQVSVLDLPLLWWFTPVGALIALGAALYFYRRVMQMSEGEPLMIEIAQAVREGAMAYLLRQYRVVAIVFAVMFVIFWGMAAFGLVSFIMPFAFVLGGLFSALAGFIGMRTATNASARTAWAAQKSLNEGLQVAFRGGAVMGLSVVGFALLNISLLLLGLLTLAAAGFFTSASPLNEVATVMVSAVFGASAMALFARVGGGIFTKAADVGADLVGKVEAGIPEDDPRNPATIADNVGDNVGDVAGMGADLYESYMGSILATVSIGVGAVAVTGGTLAQQFNYLALPMVLAAVGVVISLLAMRFVRVSGDVGVHALMGALERGVQVASVGIAVAALPLVFVFQIENAWQIWGAILTGLVVGVVIGRATEFYTSSAYKPTQAIAEQGLGGPATIMIEGLAVGMRSTMIPVVTIGIGISVSFVLSGGANSTLMGLYGVGLAAVAMLSTLGITLATDAYGPIADNAGGNAQMAGLPPEVRDRTDQLDAVGNTTAATGKGFAIGSAALTALALLAAYIEQIRFELGRILEQGAVLPVGERLIPLAEMTIRDFTTYYDITPLNPSVVIGLFLGAMVVFYFSAMTMSAVGRAAKDMVDEVRRQFEQHPHILTGLERPDYARCVGISTVSAQREMVLPSLVAIIVPVITGILFGVPGVFGLLAGSLSTGFVVAIMMSNAGGAWDNAKKYVEQGHFGGTGSDAHKAAVVGDTVGDPFKDTSGPALNILIKLMGIVAVVFASLTANMGQGGILGMLLDLMR